MCEGWESWGKDWEGDGTLRTHPRDGMKSLIVRRENGGGLKESKMLINWKIIISLLLSKLLIIVTWLFAPSHW